MKKYEEDILLLEDQNSKFLKVSREGSEVSKWMGLNGKCRTVKRTRILQSLRSFSYSLHSRMDEHFILCVDRIAQC